MLRDPKSIADFTLGERIDLQIKHQALISRLRQGRDVEVPLGSMSTKLMGELTVASEREVALLRIGGKRYLRLGIVDEFGHGVLIADADRVVAHSHVSGELRFSVGPDSDMAVITNPVYNLTKQKSSVLVAPDGTGIRLPIQR